MRFGVFEVDLSGREIRKHGLKLNLQDQPFDALAAMLERPRQIVTREDLILRLWPQDTFVDFDHSLNACIAKLRQTLSDSADNPHFIETVPRRGYRFIAPVEFVGSTPSATVADAVQQPGPSEAPPVRRRWIGGPARWVLLIAIAASLGAIVILVANRSKTDSGLTLIRLTSDSGLTSYPTLARDKALVAYASDRAGNGNLDLWVQQPVPGARAIQLTTDSADEYEPSFSPDGSRIAYRSEKDGGGIYTISALGGEPRLIAKTGRGPQFSPDGRWIAFWRGMFISSPLGAGWGSSEIFVVSADSGEVRAIETGLHMAAHPIWAPDSKHLLIYGARVPAAGFPLGRIEVTADWWVIPVSGGTPRPTGAFDAFRRQELATTYPAEIPRPAAWLGEWVLFYARRGDAVNVWRVRIPPSELRVIGSPERLSSGTNFEVYPSPFSGGEFVFASLSRSVNIWRLPGDTNRASFARPIEQLTDGIWIDGAPSISLDGKRVAFHSNRSGGDKEEIWVRNIENGRQSLLARGDSAAQQPQISRSGSIVAYTSGDADYLIPADGGVPKELCRGCSMVWDWSPDERVLLLSKRGDFGRIHAFDRTKKMKRVLLESADQGLFQARFSPDQRWVAFFSLKLNGRLWIAPIRSGEATAESGWIPLTEATGWFDKPRWSPDGNTIYYVAERDGFSCLWAQRLEPTTKHPAGPPVNIQHFHSARLSMRNVGYGLLETGIARDSIVFNLGELTGNIWLARSH